MMSRIGFRGFVAAFGLVWVACGHAGPAEIQLPIQLSQGPSKKDLTPAQKKLDSHLLVEIFRRQGTAEKRNRPIGPTGVKIDKQDRAYVDIRAEVTSKLRKKVEAAGSKIVSTSVQYRSIVAWVPILSLEKLAEDATIYSIIPTPEPVIKS